MTASTIIDISLIVLAGISILTGVYFVSKALSARSSVRRQAYDVGQVEARRSTQINFVRAGFCLLLSLIFIGVYGILPAVQGTAEAEPLPLEPGLRTPNAEVIPTAASTIPPTRPPVTVAPSPTAEAATPAPTAQPSPTPVPQPTTATVSSGVGVWLRSAPGTNTEQLEWLLDGTVVTLLDAQQTVDNLVWQNVRTEAGTEGWVARDYLVANPAQP